MKNVPADLFRHMEWADATIWAAVLAHPKASEDVPVRDRLFHLHVTQRAFFAIWTSAPMDIPKAASFQNTAAIRDWARGYYSDALAFAEAPDDLDRPVVLPWAETMSARFGAVQTPTLGETMLQVAGHSTYHRGQINARLRDLGCEPPLVDYIAWILRGRPAPEW